MKVAIYCRVSTDDKEQDPMVQLYRCREYCQKNNHKIIDELIDDGISGDTYYYDRPQGEKLAKLIDKERIKGIVVFSIDRFSRQNPLKILPMLNRFRENGLKFISITEPIFNMESEYAEPMRYMLTWFSNYFLKQHKTKVKAGIEKAQKYGTKSGIPIGRKRKVNYESVVGLYKQGMSVSGIAKKLSCNKSSVWYAIYKFKNKSL